MSRKASDARQFLSRAGTTTWAKERTKRTQLARELLIGVVKYKTSLVTPPRPPSLGGTAVVAFLRFERLIWRSGQACCILGWRLFFGWNLPDLANAIIRSLAMSPGAEQILQSALALPQVEQIELIEAIIAALDVADPQPLDETWMAEIRRRSAEFDAGKVKPIPWPEVRERSRGRSAPRGQ